MGKASWKIFPVNAIAKIAFSGRFLLPTVDFEHYISIGSAVAGHYRQGRYCRLPLCCFFAIFFLKWTAPGALAFSMMLNNKTRVQFVASRLKCLSKHFKESDIVNLLRPSTMKPSENNTTLEITSNSFFCWLLRDNYFSDLMNSRSFGFAPFENGNSQEYIVEGILLFLTIVEPDVNSSMVLQTSIFRNHH